MLSRSNNYSRSIVVVHRMPIIQRNVRCTLCETKEDVYLSVSCGGECLHYGIVCVNDGRPIALRSALEVHGVSRRHFQRLTSAIKRIAEGNTVILHPKVSSTRTRRCIYSRGIGVVEDYTKWVYLRLIYGLFGGCTSTTRSVRRNETQPIRCRKEQTITIVFLCCRRCRCTVSTEHVSDGVIVCVVAVVDVPATAFNTTGVIDKQISGVGVENTRDTSGISNSIVDRLLTSAVDIESSPGSR